MPEVAHPVRLTKTSPIPSSSTTPSADAAESKLRPRGNPGTSSHAIPSAATNSLHLETPEVFSSPRIPSITTESLVEGQSTPGAPIDPISRKILERTKSHSTVPRILPINVADVPFTSTQKPHATSSPKDVTEATTLRRNDSVGSVNKGGKEKRKGPWLFSRFIGTKKRDIPSTTANDTASLAESRPADAETEVFSRPIGFVPQLPAPPRYIRVRASNRKKREFERVFLAQVLLERTQRSRRKTTGDEEIVHIDEARVGPGQPYNRAVWAMEFSKDGRYLAAAGQDKKVRVWAVITSTEDREAHESEEEEKNHDQPGVRLNAPVLRTRLIREYQGHTSSILDLSWSKNNFLLSSSMDKTVRLWHVSQAECLCAFKHHDFVTSISFHPRDDRFFLAGSLDSKLRLWSIPDKAVAYWVNVPDMVTAVAFTPDGKTCIAGCLNGLCLFYDTDKLKLHSQLHVRSARGRNAKGSKITGIDTITLPPGDPNGDVKLLITSNDSRIRMYNYKDRNLEIKFRGNENTCSQIHATFSDDGRYVICGSEDKKVYIWPTGPTEKQDQDKRPVEVLEAHSAIVTSAILAPTKTRQHLAHSRDPIYDLCNPPPVTLMGNDSVNSSRTRTEGSQSVKEMAHTSLPPSASVCRKAEETPAYLARHAHPGGNIIVTADYLGQIKIFRQDCAFQKRRYDSFDSASLFSKNRLLGRSGSVTTRTSLSPNRNSMLNSNSRNNSADRIINWRNSISNVNSNNLGGTVGNDANTTLHRARSDSPRKLAANVLSPHMVSAAKPPSIITTSPSSSQAKSSNESSRFTGTESGAIGVAGTLQPSVGLDVKDNQLNRDADNGASQQGNHNYRYWDREQLAAMAQREPRTPGLLNPDDLHSDPLSRKQSSISKMSSDISSEETAPSEAVEQRANEVKCANCGGKSFHVQLERRRGVQEKRLNCKRCGNTF